LEELLKYGNKSGMGILEQYKSNSQRKESVNVIKEEVEAEVRSSKLMVLLISVQRGEWYCMQNISDTAKLESHPLTISS
jgi:hypothetical protein